MRKLLIILLLLAPFFGMAQTYEYKDGTNTDQFITVGQLSEIRLPYLWYISVNALIYLPPGYDSANTAKKYPLICFFHGQGEAGTDPIKLENNGIPQLISQGDPPYAVDSNGDTTKFIVVAMQNGTFSPSASDMNNGLMSLLSYYKLNIDQNRVYSTGLSAGGQNSAVFGQVYNYKVAATVSMSPASHIDYSGVDSFAHRWIWYFQGTTDPVISPTNAYYSVDTINAYYPGHAKLTTWDGGHGPWNPYYTPSYSDPTTGGNIYDWMMQYDLVTEDGGTAPLSPPTVNAGSDQTLSSGTTSATLSGTASTNNGNITSYAWTTTSGATITSPSSASTTVTGLADGNSYIFRLTATDDSSQTAYDEVTVTVDSAPSVPDTADYKIVLSPYAKFYDGKKVFLQLNDLTGYGLCKYLIDEQGADPLNGVDTPTPTTTFYAGSSSNIAYPAMAVIDLGGTYKLTHQFLYRNFGTDTINILYGTPFNWSTDTLRYGAGGSGFVDLKDTVYTRYLKVFYSLSGNQKFKELILYGHLVGDSLSRVNPNTPHKSTSTMGQFLGVNVYGATPEQVREVGGMLRKYTNQSYMDTVPAGIPVDSLEFVFTKYAGNTSTEHYFFPYGFDDGPLLSWKPDSSTLPSNMDLYWATQGLPQYSIDSGWSKAIDYDLHPNADGDSALQYDRLSRMAWTLGAVYGKNTYPTDSVQELVFDHSSGKDEFHYIEAGNENNGGWLGDAYYDPRQATAYMSAYYNGNGGLMGSRMGIKNADSTIKVLFWGDVSNVGDLHLDYLRAMNYWSTYTLKDSTLPFDVYNIHEYSYDTKAISPENYKGGYREYYKGLVDTAHIMCPICEVWLTEWGFDRNRKSPLAVPIIAGKDSAQIQAEWIARGWLELSFSGLDRAQLFQIQNDPLSKDYDSTGVFKFNTSGLTSGHQRANFDLNYYAFPAYYFQKTIWTNLMNYTPDSVIYENHDSIWVYRYKNIANDSIAYAIWSGTQTNRSTDSFAIKTGHPNTAASIVLLEDKRMTGAKSSYTANSDGEIPIVINETPKLIFTTSGTDGGQLMNYTAPVVAKKPKLLLYLFDGKLISTQ